MKKATKFAISYILGVVCAVILAIWMAGKYEQRQTLSRLPSAKISIEATASNLNTMRAELDKAPEDFKKKSGFAGTIGFLEENIKQCQDNLVIFQEAVESGDFSADWGNFSEQGNEIPCWFLENSSERAKERLLKELRIFKKFFSE